VKFSEHWLRTFADPPLGTGALAHALTFAGLEVEEVEPVAPAFAGVVVGEVLSVEKHPAADRLTVCRVSAGDSTVTIVCGAPNVRAGMKVPTALPGAKLPALEISAANVRGVESHGMLCSEKELGLSDEASGLMALAEDAPVGRSVREVLDLDDHLFTTKPTPNRGDCLSILGVAREVAAVTGAKLRAPAAAQIEIAVEDKLEIGLDAPHACPRYCGRIVRGVKATAATPDWIIARLERSGLRPISAIVDVTNYVMLELGQPLHAFDAAKLVGSIRVRFARDGETLALLNGESPALDSRYLVIADQRKAVALAGIMGGADTAVNDDTADIFLESAYFTPDVIAGKSRELGFGSDSSFRFERGVDFEGTRRALDRATELILKICGGHPGPVSEASGAVPTRAPVELRLGRAKRLLGIDLTTQQAEDIFRRLDFVFTRNDDTFVVTPPSYRFDISIEQDLIEELARIHGYDRIPAAAPTAPTTMLPAPERVRTRDVIRSKLVSREYNEVVTYSFIDRRWEEDFCGNSDPVALANPIASQMSVMRSSLIPGLVTTAALNVRHKQTRVRLFEIGRCFATEGDGYAQPTRVGALAYGDALREQWGTPNRRVDFYDMKGDLEALLAPVEVHVDPASHPALHPGRSGRVRAGVRAIGWVGELHPRWQQKYELPTAPMLLELDYDAVEATVLPVFREVPKFPAVRRDIAALFDDELPYEAILGALKGHAPAIVTDVRVFDLYRGADLPKGKKSLAFMVLLQDTRKTLTDAEVESAVSQLREMLRQQFGATLR
jgi:phenylalanyl-tRNA synthetase beta chain